MSHRSHVGTDLGNSVRIKASCIYLQTQRSSVTQASMSRQADYDESVKLRVTPTANANCEQANILWWA